MCEEVSEVEITVTYRPQGYGQLRELMDLIEEARDAKISFEVLGEVVGERPEKRQRVGAQKRGAKKGKAAAARSGGGPGPFVRTVSEAASQVGVTPITIRNWVERGDLSGKKVGGRLMIHSSSLGKVIRAREAASRSAWENAKNGPARKRSSTPQ